MIARQPSHPASRVPVVALAIALATLGAGCGPRDADAALRGSSWSLAAFEPPRGPEATPVSTITMAFDAERDEVTGTAGCNQFRADYRLDGTTFTLKPIDTSRMVCGNGRVMANERDFMLAIETAGRLERAGDALLLDAAGGWRLRFARDESAAPGITMPLETEAP